MTWELLAVFVGSSLRLATPLLLAAMGELISERAGVLNMSLEGFMLVAAFGAALGAWATGSPSLGLLCGLAAVVPCALFQAWLSVTLRANQIVVGIGFNILALGVTTLLYRSVFGARSREQIPGFDKMHVPGLSEIPFLGPALFQQIWLVYLAFALALGVWLFLRHTALGLAVRAAGADPRAADKAGLSVARVRYFGVLCAGLFGGLAGMFLSIGDIHTFTEGMTNGAGYLAIAAVIFGSWKVWRTLGACLLFGAATALQFQLPAMGVQVPTALLIMLPYLMALLAVAGLIGRQTPPSFLGVPYDRADRAR